jgi:hypothetical protein
MNGKDVEGSGRGQLQGFYPGICLGETEENHEES